MTRIHALILAALASTPALAVTTDDVKWINQCASDNADQGATKEVVLNTAPA